MAPKNDQIVYHKLKAELHKIWERLKNSPEKGFVKKLVHSDPAGLKYQEIVEETKKSFAALNIPYTSQKNIILVTYEPSKAVFTTEMLQLYGKDYAAPDDATEETIPWSLKSENIFLQMENIISCLWFIKKYNRMMH